MSSVDYIKSIFGEATKAAQATIQAVAGAASDAVSSPPLHGHVPKAVLYYQHRDPWSSAVLLALCEKGYAIDELEWREVDIAKGGNYDPTYLRINGIGAVPTLVVPMDRFIGPEIESRYKSVSDVAKILEFVDKSRTVVSKTHTTSTSPSPALAPATIDAMSKSNVIIDLIHSAPLDLEFFYLSARAPEELSQKAQGEQLAYLKDRSARLEAALNPVPSSPDPNDPAPALTSRSRESLEAREALYKSYLDVYSSSASPDATPVQEFIEKSKRTWNIDVQAALEMIEKTIKVSHVAAGEESLHDNHSDALQSKGPASTKPVPPDAIASQKAAEDHDERGKPGGLILGEQLCLADLHLFPWLARLVSLAGGDLSASGIKKLEGQIGDSAGDRVVAFWQAMLQRDSVKRVYGNSIH